MMERKLHGILTSVVVLGTAWIARAEPDIQRDAEQCLKAQTAVECRAALSYCQRVLADIAQMPIGSRVEGLHVRVLNGTGWCENQLGQYAEAESHMRRTLELRQRLNGPEHPDVASSLNNLAAVLSNQGKYAQAETVHRQALAMSQKLLGDEHLDVALSLNNLAAVLESQGKYEQAESLHRRALTMKQKLLGAEHPSVATSLNNLAAVLSSQGKYEAAETLYRQGLQMRQKLLGTEHLLIASNLNDLGWVLSMQGKFAPAETLYRQALGMKQKLLGAEHPDVATSLNNLADLLSQQGRYDEAELMNRQALAMRQKLLGAEHPDVATSLNNLAGVLSRQGKYEQAETHYRQVLAMRQRLLGVRHPYIGSSLSNLASVLDHQGKYEQAETLHRQALTLRQKLLGVDHPDVAISLNNLASVLYHQGKYEQAETLYQQALAMKQKQLGTEHPDVASSINNLAIVRSHQGKHEQAETMYRQALAIRQKLLGIEHPDVASSINNLADILSLQGKDEQAENLYRQALAMRQKLLGAEHPAVAGSLSNLAFVLDRQGKYEHTESLLQQALDMRRKLLGAEHPAVASSINNLAGELADQRRLQEAEPLYQQALAMRQKLLGAEHPDVASSLNNLAFVLSSQGKYEAAEKPYRQGLAMRQKLLGAEHPDVASSLNNLAFVLMKRGQFPTALPLFTQAMRIEESRLRATSSETRMRTVLGQVRDVEDALYGLLQEQPNDEKLKWLVMTTALLRKGRAAEAGTMANRLLHQSRSNPRTKEPFERWQQVRQQREALLYGSGVNLSPVAYRERLKELSQQADDMESQLAAAMPELRKLQPPKFDDVLSAVAARLPKDGVLIEVVRAEPYNFKAKATEDRWTTPHYLALVMTADQQIAVQDLGEAASLDSQVQALLASLRNPAMEPMKNAKAMYERVLKPLLPEAVKQVYLSLDGSLSLVPFDALHDGTDYLLGRKTFHYLTSGRDLLRTDSTESKQAALLLADPDFGRALAVLGMEKVETFYRRLAGLTRLPGAQEEAKQIGPLLHVAPIVAGAAKESVVRAARGPWVLHIASHGLFLNGRDLPRSGGRGGALLGNLFGSPFAERKGVLIGDFGSEAMGMRGDTDSLSRSALVLADAAQGERAQSAAEDGLLTAEEARSLDLFGTQLVVLSACDTGQGELSVGQGVYGLRRAFLVAGAETLVTSLWQVNDSATGKLMQMYYQKLLKEKKGRLEGMQEAMKEMREKYKHPYYWAPFLVIGSDGPLRPPVSLSQR